jgi:hypothetical protein
MDTEKEEDNIRNDASALIKRVDRITKDQYYAEFSILILRALLLISNCIRQGYRK